MAETDILLRIRAIAEMSDATEAAAEVKKLAAQVDNLQEEAAKVGTGMPAATGATKNMGMAALQAGQFVDDMQYGLRGVVNNIPSLVMSLGGGMGLAGAIGIAAVAINQLVNWLGKAKDGATDAADATAGLADKIKEVAENAAANAAEDRQATRDAAADRLRATQADLAPEKLLADTRREGEVSAIANEEKLLVVQERIATLMGEQVNLFDQLLKRQKAADERAEVTARHEIEKERARALAAAKAVSDRMEEGDLVAANIVKNEESIAQENRKIEALRIQRDELRKIAENRMSLGEALMGAFAQAQGSPTAKGFEDRKQMNEAADRAASQMQWLDAQIGVAELDVTKMWDEVKGMNSELKAAGKEVAAAQKQAGEVAQAAAEKIAQINESFPIEAVDRQTKQIAEKSTKLTESLETFLKDVDTKSGKLQSNQQMALADFEKILANGSASVEEFDKAARDMNALLPSLKTSSGQGSKAYQDALKLMQQIADETYKSRDALNAMKSKVDSIPAIHP